MAKGIVGLEDLRLLLITDDIEVAMTHIRQHAIDAFAAAASAAIIHARVRFVRLGLEPRAIHV